MWADVERSRTIRSEDVSDQCLVTLLREIEAVGSGGSWDGL